MKIKAIWLGLCVTFFSISSYGANATDKPSTDLYRELELFTKALSHVERDYAEVPDNKKLVYGAIRGMLATLDPHSIFMSPELYKEIKVDTQGWFGGVGIEITVKDGHLIVVAPIEGSPAERAGIQPGDTITKIDGTPVKGLSLTETVQKMRGAKGTKMVLTISRNGTSAPKEVTVLRDIIHIKSVRSETLEDGYGYVRINSFQEGTSKELEKALKALEKKSDTGLQGLVIDLRNNPGGLLEEAVSISDKFLTQGTIVSTSSRGKEIDRRVATVEGTHPHYPVVILVNRGSASASEIVAAALQENKRAVLMGTKTFGKGSVQTIFELGGGSAIKLTIAKYFTPKGKSIHGKGIQPDIIIENPKRPLKGQPETKESRSEEDVEAEEKANDYQKKMALDYLKKHVKRPLS